MLSGEEQLSAFDSIPLLCVRCGFQITVAEPSAEVLAVLCDVSTLRESPQILARRHHELTMLQRTKALFDRFPDSRHPQKMCKEFLSKEDRPKMEADPELDRALDADPELKAFLRRSSFWLPARMKFATEAVNRLEHPNLQLIACSNCQDGYYCIEPNFFADMFCAAL